MTHDVAHRQLTGGESLFVEGFKLLLAQCPQIICEITGVWPSLEQLDYELTGDGPDAVVMELAMLDGDEQAAMFSAGMNPLGIVTSNALAATLGF